MAPFEIEDTIFNCVEQFYQHSKAVACNNLERARKIMKCTDPKRMKELGDGIRNSDEWIPERVPTLYAGAVAKFQQNPDLAISLISTGNTGLYEATTDKYFGCGIGLQTKKWNKKEWTGENVAGRIIMKVRAELTGEAIPSTTGFSLDSSELTTTTSSHTSLNASNMGSHITERKDEHKLDAKGNTPTSNPTHQPANQSRAKGSNSRRRSNRGNHRGRGRGSTQPNSSNVTDRTHRRQSAYQAKLSEKDQEFLKMTKPSLPNDEINSQGLEEITTSTPKSPLKATRNLPPWA